MVVNFYTITGFINFLTSSVLAILVILHNRKNPKCVSFFILAMMVGLWSLSYFFWQNITDNEKTALMWCRILMFFTIMIPPTFFHFTLAITEVLEKRKKSLIIAYTIFCFFLLANATPIFIEKVEPVMQFKYWPIATPMFAAYLVFFGFYVFYSFYLLIKKYKTSKGVLRLQVKYVAIGVIIAFISGSFNFVPWFRIPIPPIANGLVPIYVILIAYAIARYELMNIKILARNLFLYFGLSFFLYSAFYIVTFIYKISFGNILAIETYFAGMILAPIFAVILYSSSNLIFSFINKNLFPSIYNYHQAIKKSSLILSYASSLEKITDIITETIKQTIQPYGTAILLVKNLDFKNNRFEIRANNDLNETELLKMDYSLFSEFFKKNKQIITKKSIENLIENSKNNKEILHEVENQIHQNNAPVCVPLMGGDNLLGIIILNEKKYESDYMQEDFDLLETISRYAQVSIYNIMLYKKLEEENIKFEKGKI